MFVMIAGGLYIEIRPSDRRISNGFYSNGCDLFNGHPSKDCQIP